MDEKMNELMEGISLKERNERAEKYRLNNPAELNKRQMFCSREYPKIDRSIRVKAAKYLYFLRLCYFYLPDLLEYVLKFFKSDYKNPDQVYQMRPKFVLESLAICLENDFKIPKWCREAFVNIYKSADSLEARSWADVFGPMYPKGMHLQPLRRYLKYGEAVYRRVNMLNRTEGKPIDGAMFERVGREFGIGGKTLTEEIYYKVKKSYMPKMNKGVKIPFSAFRHISRTLQQK
jgi:hypothetical protein